MKLKNLVKIIETHSPLTGMIIEDLSFKIKINLENSMVCGPLVSRTPLLKGKPDNQSVDYSSKILGLNDIMEVTTKPLILMLIMEVE